MVERSFDRNVPLAPYTTLGIGGNAEYFTRVESIAMLTDALTWADARQCPVTVLGGGSNVLVSDGGIKGLVIQIALNSIAYEIMDEAYVRVTVGAGVLLDTLIADTVAQGIWGLENLSAIPGTVGATPIQNVGAYGVEVGDCIESVTVFDRSSRTFSVLTNDMCEFGYRDSYFKRDASARYVIAGVTFVLSRVPNPKLEYRDLRERFSDTQTPDITNIREAIQEIRAQKFPDWHTLGTAGSFFKNPSITNAKYKALKQHHPLMPGYHEDNGMVKIPLGWVIEHVLHKKGYRKGNVGLYEKQALVLVHYGGATAQEVMEFSNEIIHAVEREIGVVVEREVRVL